MTPEYDINMNTIAVNYIVDNCHNSIISSKLFLLKWLYIYVFTHAADADGNKHQDLFKYNFPVHCLLLFSFIEQYLSHFIETGTPVCDTVPFIGSMM